MATTTTYTQTAGTEEGNQYFMDVEVNPTTLADGTLGQRFDPHRFPQVGTKVTSAPTITSVLPATTHRSDTVDLAILGTEFAAGAVVTISGTGITVSYTTLNVNGTTLTAHCVVASNATLSARTVTVTNPDGGTVGSSAALTVVAQTVTLTSVTPNTGAQGAAVPVTLAGTGFASGIVITTSGTGITVSAVSVVSSTSVTATFTMTGGATASARNVTVTNTDTGAATATGAFTVTV